MQYFNYIIKENDFFVDDTLSYVDLFYGSSLSVLDYIDELNFFDFEKLKNLYFIIKSRPSFKKILADRIIGVNPGPVATDRMLKIMKRKAIDMLGDETRWEELYDRYPGKRPATVKEVADLCAFLASPLAGYITGTIVTIDGGISSRGSVI